MIIPVILIVLIILVWAGLHIEPAPFAPYPQESQAMEMIPVPDGLPEPVDRFYRTVYGDEMPVIKSAVFTGKAKVRPFGPITFPARFRFTHIAGQSYRHYIEATFFGIPLFKVNEGYVDGISWYEIPMAGSLENDPKVNQGANLGMWAETLWMPSVFLTNPRARWEPVDEVTAVLVVPFGKTEQDRFVVRFDPDTGLVTYMESMRYHGAESTQKTLWLNESREWGTKDGKPYLKTGAAIWMDDGKPWAIFTVEDVVYNVDLSEYILAKGQ